MIHAWFDGCCEPVNPGGTCGYGAVILEDDRILWKCSELLKVRTGEKTSNNLAEYAGLFAILAALEAFGKQKEPITVYGDSRLVILQMTGEMNIRSGAYADVARACRGKLPGFPALSFVHIPRELNEAADALSKAPLIRAGVEFRIQPLSEKGRQKILALAV